MARTISEAVAKTQLKRLEGFHGFDGFRAELLRIAQRDSKSLEHLERIVTGIVDSRRPNEAGFVSCPTPAELGELLREPEASANFQAPKADCPDCSGTGWAMRAVMYKGNFVDNAVRCACTIRGAA